MKRQKAMRRRSDVSSLQAGLLGAEQARPRDEAVGDQVERAARGRERAPGREPGVQLREPGIVAVEHPDGGDRRDRDDVRDQVERAPLPREPDAGAARDEPAASWRDARAGAVTTACTRSPLLGGLLGRCGRLLHRLLHLRGRRAQREPR